VEAEQPAHPHLVMKLLARTLWAGVALAAACAAAAARAESVLTVCTENAPDGFDIAQYESGVTIDAAGRTIYDQLVLFRPGTTEVMPGIAERWDISADGTVYTFHIRHGVKFHTTPWFRPTRELNADDVVWSLGRLANPKHPAHRIAKNGYVYWESMGLGQLVQRIEKVDAYTVRVTLARPEAPFLADLAVEPIGSIYSAEYGEQLARAGRLDELNTHPVGSGPFIFQSYQKDAVIRYAANKDHWQGPPKVDRLIFAITNDPNLRIERLRAQECLVGINMKPEQASAFDRDAHVQIVRNTNALMTFYIAPNAKHRWTGDARFRRALWEAIDKKSYIDAVYGGNATPAASFLPAGMWSFDRSLTDRHDVEDAKRLVKASGYDGRELSLFVWTGGSFDGKRAAELLQADWAKVGIRVKPVTMEWGEMLKRTGRGEHDITFLSWSSDNGDPDNFFTPNLSCAAVAGGGNKAQWCNGAFDQLLDEARRNGDHARRAALYQQAQKLLYDDVGVIPGVYPVYMTAVNKRVSGYVPDPFTRNDFRNVSVK
jgi:dipeptide transport system substrate-binding protein